MAVAKQHDLGPHLIRASLRQAIMASVTPGLLDDPLVWKTIRALARFIENDGGDGCYDAMGTVAFEVGDDSAALKLIRDMGLTRGCRRLDDDDPPAFDPDGGSSGGGQATGLGSSLGRSNP